jgi:hypothetical protein
MGAHRRGKAEGEGEEGQGGGLGERAARGGAHGGGTARGGTAPGALFFALSVRWLCCVRKKGRGRGREEKKMEEKKKNMEFFLNLKIFKKIKDNL